MQLIKAVVFDLDGTMIQLPINYDELMKKFSTITGTSNLHPLSQKISTLDHEKRRQVFSIWDEVELQALKEATIKEEGLALYRKYLHKPKALVTMQGKALTEAAMEKMTLSFDLVVTREESMNRVTQLKIAAKTLGVSLKDILFVGNTKEDASAAEKANCQFQRVS